MNPAVGAALATSAPSAASGIAGAISSAVIAKRTRQHQMKMAEYSYNKDLEQWHRQNAYNSPTQQMARLKSAGLSPHLVYGSGSSGASGRATESPKYQAPATPYAFDMPDLGKSAALGIQTYQDVRMKNQQLDNMETARNLQQLQALKTMAQTNQINIRSGIDTITQKYHEKQLATTIDLQHEKILSEQVKRNGYELGNALKGQNLTLGELKIEFQKDVNRLASKDLTLGTAMQWKLLDSFIQGLGYESIQQLAQTLGVTSKDVKKTFIQELNEGVKQWQNNLGQRPDAPFMLKPNWREKVKQRMKRYSPY